MEQNKLPAGWSWVKLGEVSIDIRYGYTASSSQETNGPKFLRITDIQDSKVDWSKVPYCTIEDEIVNKYLLQENDIVFARTGATVGKSFLIKGQVPKSVFASYLIRLQLSEYVLPLYVYLFFQSSKYWVQIKESSAGIGQPNVNAAKLKNLEVPLPPLDEQHRIVEKIEELFSELDNGVANLKKAKEQIKVYKQSVLKYAFEGKLVQGKMQYGKGKSENGGLPEGWEWRQLEELGTIQRGKSKHRPRNDEILYGGKYPFIQTGDIRNSQSKYLNDYSQTYSERGLEQSKLWPKGTLCITIAANIADTAILGFDSCFPDSVVGFVPNEVTSSHFIYYFFKSQKNNLEKLAPATAQKNINVSILNKINVALPPKYLQTQIVEEIERRFSVADKMEAAIVESLKKAEGMRQSILKQAFEGKLV